MPIFLVLTGQFIQFFEERTQVKKTLIEIPKFRKLHKNPHFAIEVTYTVGDSDHHDCNDQICEALYFIQLWTLWRTKRGAGRVIRGDT
uniref:Uncharacterized protein n=1 Tax=Romanomermis culicivorax TaxID=13658 RepID=A0A915HL64_ROMCU